MKTFQPVRRCIRPCIRALIFFTACIAAPFSAVPFIHATELEITLVSGSVFRAEVPLDAINWKEVQSDGQMTSRRIPTRDIARLWLCETPASNQVAEIGELLSRLQSDDYRTREQAETKLSLPEVGGRFPKMLRQLAAGADLETKYRIGRILDKISDAESSTISQFDELELKSGRILRGDAGGFGFTCAVDGQRLNLQRNQLQMLRHTDANRPREIEAQAEPVTTEIVLESKGKFYLPEQTTVSFDTDPLGNELIRKMDIGSVFTPLGLMLGCAEPGYVGISGYGFKYPDTPTGDNSGSVFTAVKNGNQVRYKKFRGTLTIDFCMPNQPHIPAGVNEFGIHIATVNHERDFIMEAFNGAGQVIATVEAGERDCPFLGVRSNELIARLRIRNNPFLGKLQRKIDDDYAFDSICFSKPEILLTAATTGESDTNKTLVRLKSGNFWVAGRIELKRDGTIELFDDDFEMPLTFATDAVEFLSLPDTSDAQRPKRSSWSVQLTDGSILNVAPGKVFHSQLIPDYIAPTDQIVAIWPTGSPARFAHTEDWEDAKNVIVLPTGRLLTNQVNFTATGYSWQTRDRRLQALAPNARDLARNEDPMPDLEQVVYKDVDNLSAPTLWLQQPMILDSNAGSIVLRDGQRLMLGEGRLFQLVSLRKDSIELTLNGRAVEIDNDRVLTVKFEPKR